MKFDDLAPRWVTWIMTRVSSACTSSVSFRSQGTTSSVLRSMLPKAAGESRDTIAEPPIIVIPSPPRAFSTW